MTAYRPSIAVIALFALMGVALAQETSPPAATGAPTPLGGAAPATVEDGPVETPSDYTPGTYNRDSTSAISSADLGLVDGAPAGTLTDANGGLGQSLWINSDRAEIEDLLGRIPLVSDDPFVHALARRVVLTVSDAPAGAARRALITIRIERLVQAGMLDEAGTIAAAVHLDNDPDFARVQAEALLYAGRDAEICSPLTALRLTAPDPFWLELRTWCFRAAGDDANADLMAAAFEAQGIRDPAFEILATDALHGKKIAPPIVERPTALHVYLLRKANMPVPAAFAAKLGTAANLLAARDSRNGPADRLAAAARISATGALSSADLLAILNAQTVPAAQLAQAQATAAKLPFLPAQALLRRAASLESRPPAKAELLLAALIPGGHIERLPLAAALQSDIALAIKPDPSTVRFRFAISRALFLRGKLDAAAAWYADAPDDADLRAFQILLDLAAPTPSRDAIAQANYGWFARNAAPQQNPSPQAALALGLSSVLGKPMPPEAKVLAGTLGAMRWPGARPDPVEVRRMISAAGQPGRKGEAVLRLLAIIGPNGPADLPPDVIIECVRALQLVGLDAEARTLSLEALALTRPI